MKALQVIATVLGLALLPAVIVKSCTDFGVVQGAVGPAVTGSEPGSDQAPVNADALDWAEGYEEACLGRDGSEAYLEAVEVGACELLR